jgi:hypothetical protein
MSYQRYTDKDGNFWRVQPRYKRLGKEIAKEVGIGKNWLYSPVTEKELEDKLTNGELKKV